MRIEELVTLIGSGVASALSGVLAAEFKVWLPWLTKWFFRRAIGRLPADQRERYQEEWQSHIDEIPGNIGKIIAAVGFVLAAKRMPTETAKKRVIIGNDASHAVQGAIVVNATCRIEVRAGLSVIKPPNDQGPTSTQG